MSPVETLRNCIHEKLKEIRVLEEALRVLGADVEPVMPAEPSVAPTKAPLPSDVPEETVKPAPTPAYTGPRCGACNAKMYPTYRTMPSGAVVNLLKCNDSACGNEAYQ